MHFRAIAFVIGTLLLVTSIAMLFPIVVSLIYQEGDLSALLISVTVVFSVGFPLWWFRPSHYELSFRDAVLIAVLGWVIISAVSTEVSMIGVSLINNGLYILLIRSNALVDL